MICSIPSLPPEQGTGAKAVLVLPELGPASSVPKGLLSTLAVPPLGAGNLWGQAESPSTPHFGEATEPQPDPADA